MKNKVKIVTACLCLLFLGYFGVYSIMGYLTDADILNNKIQIGYNQSEIVEDFPSQTLSPSSSVTKKVSVKNTGPVACYVRVFVGLSDENLETDKEITLDYNTKEWTKAGDWWYYNKTVKPGESTTSLITKVTAGSSYSKEDFDIIVYEETAQAKDASADADYATALEAFEAIN